MIREAKDCDYSLSSSSFLRRQTLADAPLPLPCLALPFVPSLKMMQQRAVAAKAGKEATQNARALILAREREKNQEAMARVEEAEEKRREEQRFAQQYIDAGGALGRFVKFGMACRELSTSPPFENTVLAAIMVAGGLVALNTYDGMEESMGAKVVDAIVLTIFAFEIVVKMLGEHVQFWRYFVGKEWRWNNFDFLVFLFSLPIWDAFFDGSFVLALRLMRLMRFMKIIHKIPTLRLIIEGLIGGLSAVTAISLLLFLILYLYAIVGEWWASTNTPTIPRLHLLCALCHSGARNAASPSTSDIMRSPSLPLGRVRRGHLLWDERSMALRLVPQGVHHADSLRHA